MSTKPIDFSDLEAKSATQSLDFSDLGGKKVSDAQNGHGWMRNFATRALGVPDDLFDHPNAYLNPFSHDYQNPTGPRKQYLDSFNELPSGSVVPFKQTAQDWKDKNYGGVAGDVVPGLLSIGAVLGGVKLGAAEAPPSVWEGAPPVEIPAGRPTTGGRVGAVASEMAPLLKREALSKIPGVGRFEATSKPKFGEYLDALRAKPEAPAEVPTLSTSASEVKGPFKPFEGDLSVKPELAPESAGDAPIPQELASQVKPSIAGPAEPKLPNATYLRDDIRSQTQQPPVTPKPQRLLQSLRDWDMTQRVNNEMNAQVGSPEEEATQAFIQAHDWKGAGAKPSIAGPSAVPPAAKFNDPTPLPEVLKVAGPEKPAISVRPDPNARPSLMQRGNVPQGQIPRVLGREGEYALQEGDINQHPRIPEPGEDLSDLLQQSIAKVKAQKARRAIAGQ